MPTVVLVDDHEVVRKGIRTSLEQSPASCEIVGEARSVADARDVIGRTSPDVVILDVVLPDGDGIQLCRELQSRCPATACVLLTSFPDPRGMLSATLAGAAAYLAKDSSATDLVAAVVAVARGERMLDEATVTAALDQLTESSVHAELLGQLTVQERRVFELIGQGLSNRQIGERLHLAERTVKNYSSRVLAKLQMTRRSEAAILAARLSERWAQQRARGGAGPP